MVLPLFVWKVLILPYDLKKRFLGILVAVCFIAGLNLYMGLPVDSLSDITLGNVEALAQNEGTYFQGY